MKPGFIFEVSSGATIDVSEIHDTAQQERMLHCHCGLDPQSSGGAAMDPGSGPG
jgi:hypothetical protein